MANSITPTGGTAALLRSATPDALPRLWNEKLRRFGGETDNPFKQWVALGEDGTKAEGLTGAPICVVNDLKKRGGEKVTFTVARGTNGRPSLGEERLMGKERQVHFGTYDVSIDDVRIASSWTGKEVRVLAKNGQLADFIIRSTDRSLGLIQRDFIMQRLRERVTPGRNIIYPTSSRSSIQSLQSTDRFTTDVIDRTAGVLAGIGAKPITAKNMKNGATVKSYLFFGPQDVCRSLYADPAYNTAANSAGPRDGTNILQSGGYVPWRGQDIWHWNNVDEDIQGPIGSMFNPKAKLGVAITAGTAAVVIEGGGAGYKADEQGGPIDYFRHFPGGSNIGKQTEEEVRSTANDTASSFIVAVVQTGADAGKWCMYRYINTANTGLAITTAAYSATAGLGGGRLQLAAYSTGSGAPLVGYVAWNTSLHTENVPVGSLLYHANAYGQIIGYIGALGADSILLANGGGAAKTDASFAFSRKGVRDVMSLIGDASGDMIGEGDDYGMIASLAAHAVFGVECPKNSIGEFGNHILVPCTYSPAAGGIAYA